MKMLAYITLLLRQLPKILRCSSIAEVSPRAAICHSLCMYRLFNLSILRQGR